MRKRPYRETIRLKRHFIFRLSNFLFFVLILLFIYGRNLRFGVEGHLRLLDIFDLDVVCAEVGHVRGGALTVLRCVLLHFILDREVLDDHIVRVGSTELTCELAAKEGNLHADVLARLVLILLAVFVMADEGDVIEQGILVAVLLDFRSRCLRRIIECSHVGIVILVLIGHFLHAELNALRQVLLEVHNDLNLSFFDVLGVTAPLRLRRAVNEQDLAVLLERSPVLAVHRVLIYGVLILVRRLANRADDVAVQGCFLICIVLRIGSQQSEEAGAGELTNVSDRCLLAVIKRKHAVLIEGNLHVDILFVNVFAVFIHDMEAELHLLRRLGALRDGRLLDGGLRNRLEALG